YAFSMTRTETTGLDTISLHDALPISAVQDVPPYGSAAHEADGRHRVTSRRTVAAYWQRPNHMTLGSAQKCPLEASSGASTGNVTSRVPPAGTVKPWMTSGSRSHVPQGAASWASPRILPWVVFVSRTVSVVRSPGWRVNVPVSVVAVRPVGRASVAVVPRTASAGSGTGPGTGTSGASPSATVATSSTICPPTPVLAVTKYRPRPGAGVTVTGKRRWPPGSTRNGRRVGSASHPSGTSSPTTPSWAASVRCAATTTSTSNGPSGVTSPGVTVTDTGR